MFGGDRRGIAAVEFALVAPFLIATAVGLTDIGFGLYRAMQVDDAAHAGMRYALVHGYDATAISAQVAAVDGFTVAASPAPERYCGCPSSSGVAQASCDTFCPDGSTTGTYVSVTASATYVPPISFPLIPESFALRSTSVARLQ
jgi:Flp pilus assembly protein TadG